MLGNGDNATDATKEVLFKNFGHEDVKEKFNDFDSDEMKEVEQYRALPIRIKSMYNCEEQRVVPMAPPFRGFSALVRFQCRAHLDAQSMQTEDTKQK
ncbi:hypothetical protein TELCIR_12299 [Teladorsagia circumcincta]|uniref:Uncharacterized protein n=1 Tax=Teladorsagia circumcincta TaxID=45464 RepID=A0A2G9U703_TELCI|nr:hypothetical protein TELCIR_12299 [Teladorsagia circumcincta]